MTIVQNFSSLKKQKFYPETDILIWAASLCRYKSFGYKIKLYCSEKDFLFLKKYHLYELYDEIDTTFMIKYEKKNDINDAKFWSNRKLEVLYNEYFVLGNSDFIYSDTDVLMNEPFNITDCDAMVWSPEPRIIKRDIFGNIIWASTIYPPWKYISVPTGYIMPDYIENTDDAYNCGIMYFKNRKVFLKYYREYRRFALNNPCYIDDNIDIGHVNSNIFACNSEQRILKAVLTNLDQKVKPIMPEREYGLSRQGYHFYLFRIGWRNLNDNIPQPDIVYKVLNVAIHESLNILKELNKEVYEFYSKLEWLVESNFEDIYSKVPNNIVLRKYY